jgi:mono/diheme cytochrome c family protein
MPGRSAPVAAAALAALWLLSATGNGASSQTTASATLARGRYLVAFGGCNDCHTPGWREGDGTIPEARWLTGSAVGFRGAWGTSYATNVRLDFTVMSEDAWLNAVRTRGGHPPMVWHDLRALSDADVRAIYAFVRHLGPAGVPVPDAQPPWRTPTTPYVDLRPQTPSAGTATKP